MRTFSDFEKKIIGRIIDLDEKSGSLNVLGNIFDSFSKELSLPDYCYIKAKSKTDVSIQIKKDVINSVDLRVLDNELSKFLLTTVKLFEYLEENKLAYFLGDLNLQSLGKIWADTEYVTCDFLEEESKSLLYKYIRKKIYVTEELKELARNNFKTREQRKWERELFYTRIAVLITFLGLMASIIVPMVSTSGIEIKNQIDTSNIESELKIISSELKAMSDVIDNSEKNASRNESILFKHVLEIKKAIESLRDSIPENNGTKKAHNKALHLTAIPLALHSGR